MYVHDATERAFHNGSEAMREAIIDKLRENRGRALGLERSILGDVITLVRKVEVLRSPGPTAPICDEKAESGLLEVGG